MSFIFSLFNNDLAAAILGIFGMVFLSFAIGRIIQNKFKIFQESFLFAPVLGFASYLLVTLTIFAFLALYNVSPNVYSMFLIVIDCIFLVFIFFYWRRGFPIPKHRITYKYVGKVIIQFSYLSGLMFVVYILGEKLGGFNNVDPNSFHIQAIEYALANPTSSFSLFFSIPGYELQAAYIANGSYYMFIIGTLNFSGIPVMMFMNISIPILMNLLMTFLVMSLIKSNFKYKTYLVFSPLVSIGTTFLVGTTATSSSMCGLIFVLSFISMLLLQYSKTKKENNSLLIMAILSSTLPFYMAPSGLMFFTVLSISILIFSMSSLNKMIDVILTVFISAFFLLVLFTYRYNYQAMIGTSIFAGVVIFALLGVRFIIKPTLNLNVVYEKEILILSLIISVVSSIFVFIYSPDLSMGDLGNFFTNEYQFSSNATIDLIVNVCFTTLIIIGPASFGVYYLLRGNKEKRFYGYIGIFVILFFNPFSYVGLDAIFQLNTYMGNVILFMYVPLIFGTMSMSEKTGSFISTKLNKIKV